MHNYLIPDSKVTVVLSGGFSLLVLLAIYVAWRVPTDDTLLNRLFLVAIILAFMVVAFKWISVVPNIQVSDFKMFWKKSPGALMGNPLFNSPNDYFAKYAYQSGFMIYVMTIVKLFGHHIFVMQLLNVIVQGLILIVTYCLSNKLFNNIKLSRIAVIILAIDLDWFALNSQVNNQYLASLLFLLTFYLVTINKLWLYCLSGLTLSLGWIVRPIGPVILIAIICYSIWWIFNNKPKPIIIRTFALTAICLMTIFSANELIKASGLNQYGLADTDTEWKFIAGLNYDSNGMYSKQLDEMLNASSSRETNKAKEKQVLTEQIENLNNNNSWISLFAHKMSILWSRSSDVFQFTSFDKIHSQNLLRIVTIIGFLGSFTIIIFSWVGSIRLLKSKIDSRILLLTLTILGFALVELIIEVQGRYRIEFLPILSIFAGAGVDYLAEMVGERKKRSERLFQNRTIPDFKITDENFLD